MLKKLFEKSLLYFGTLVAGKILSAVFFMVLARLLQPEKFGEISFFITVVQVVSVLADVGLKSWYQKEAAQRPLAELWARLIRYRLLTGGVVAIIVLVLNTWWQWFAGAQIYLLLACIMGESWLTMADGYYLARSQSLRLGYKLIVRNVILFVCLVWLRQEASTLAFLSWYTLTLWLTVGLYVPWRTVAWRQVGRKLAAPDVKTCASYAAIDDLGVLYSRADSMVIERLLGSSSLGIYAAAYRFVDAFNLLPQALFHNLFPVAARKNGVTRGQTLKMWVVMAGMGVAVGVVLFIASDFLTVTLLGEAYAPAAGLLRMFAVLVALFFANAPLNTIIQSSDVVSRYVPWLTVATILNIGLNIVWLPTYGLYGSVYSMIAAELFLTVVNWVMMRKIYEQK